MRYYWVKDKETQQWFKVYWRSGVDNKADYYSKHHPIKHHKQVRSTYNLDGEPNP